MPSFSVVLPTRGRPADALRAVRSLLAQTEPPAEILVVDSVPTDDALERTVLPVSERVRLFREPLPGVCRARNRALPHAKGDVIAFLDDDAEAAPDWLERMRVGIEETAAWGIGGPAIPVWDAPPPAFLRRSPKAQAYLGAFDLSPTRKRLSGFHDFFIGTNCAFRREIFDAGERFLEIAWGRPSSGGDLEFSQRVAARHPCVYDPAVRVFHHMSADKTRWTTLAFRAFDWGVKKVAIGRRLSPRGPKDLWGVDGLISAVSGLGYLYGQCLRVAGGRPTSAGPASPAR